MCEVQNKRRILLVVLAFIGLLLGCDFLLNWWHTYSQAARVPTYVHLPDVAQIKTITAKLHEPGGTPVPEYEVPSAYYSTLLGAMIPAQKVDPWFTSFGEIGHLTIITKNDENIEIDIFFAGINPVCITVNGVSCTRGGLFESFNPKVTDANWYADESSLLVGVIAEIYRVHFQQKSNEWLEMHIDKLKVSRGDKPPPNQ